MRILYLDLDTLRADHLGCYGYHRNTSPNIDAVAREGIRFENCYVSDAPCLPSRAALFNVLFGIHTGVVGHGGTAAEMRIQGAERRFNWGPQRASWVMAMRQLGMYTVSISPFAERHSAWWFYHGFNEMYNPGKRGGERADEVAPIALEWIERNGEKDNWFLHINFWDPHTPYRTPLEYGNPFEDSPPPSWYTEEIRRAHYESYGPHSAREPFGWRAGSASPRMPAEIGSMEDYKMWIDGYDTGIKYMDDHIGQILDALAHKGVLEETAVII
ncbi:sulfatase, partial [Candidatus Poribacteria bacterium]